MRGRLGPGRGMAERIDPVPATTDPTELGRPTCYRCLRPRPCCVCASIQPIDNRTRVLIVQHPRERRHPFGTARLARLGLRRVDVHVAERDGSTRTPPGLLPGTALLYPAPGAPCLGTLPEPPRALVVLDGTWSTVSTLRRASPWLATLPAVALAPSQPGRYRIRKAPRPAVQLSTIEAIVGALQQLEPDTPGLIGLLDAFERMVDQQLALEQRHRAASLTAWARARSCPSPSPRGTDRP